MVNVKHATRSSTENSLLGLDAVNLFLAAALAGFGPYVAVFLAQRDWTRQDIGFALTAAGLAGLLSQPLGGELLDVVRSKRIIIAIGAMMVATAALIIAFSPNFPLVLTALVLQGLTGGFLGLGIAAVSLGLVGQFALAERLGRNQRFASTGGVIAAVLMGLVGEFISYRAIFVTSAVLVLPLLFALARIQSSDIHHGRACGAPEHDESFPPTRVRRRTLWQSRALLTFAACIFLFQLANASVLPLLGEELGYGRKAYSSLTISALVIAPQIIVALMAPAAARAAQTWGRRPLLLLGFAALPIRTLLFAATTDPAMLIAGQLLDGVSGTVLGVLTALVIADATQSTGRFNLAQGLVGLASGIGAALSTTLSGVIAGELGRTAGFLSIAGEASAALLLLWLLMPETNPSHPTETRSDARKPRTASAPPRHAT
jgi:predicted MFS family arabinose efflux permease